MLNEVAAKWLALRKIYRLFSVPRFVGMFDEDPRTTSPWDW